MFGCADTLWVTIVLPQTKSSERLHGPTAQHCGTSSSQAVGRPYAVYCNKGMCFNELSWVVCCLTQTHKRVHWLAHSSLLVPQICVAMRICVCVWSGHFLLHSLVLRNKRSPQVTDPFQSEVIHLANWPTHSTRPFPNKQSHELTIRGKRILSNEIFCGLAANGKMPSNEKSPVKSQQTY